LVINGNIKTSNMRKIKFDKCIVGTGKAGIDFSAKLAQKYDLPNESKS